MFALLCCSELTLTKNLSTDIYQCVYYISVNSHVLLPPFSNSPTPTYFRLTTHLI